MQTTKQTIYNLIIILIFGSGLAIFVWNKIQGRDLSQPPNFDLSAYDDFALTAELEKRANAEINPLIEKLINEKKVEATAETIVEEPVGAELESGYIYFRDSFRSTSVLETNKLIKSFLKDFPALKDVVVENLEANIKAKIEVPALGREVLLADLKLEPDVLSLEIIEAPIWQIAFKDGKTDIEMTAFFDKYQGVKVQSTEAEVKIENYIARIKISDLNLDQAVIDKLQKEYSDVIKVVL